MCGATCFELTASYTTPAYVSLDLPRAVTLQYLGTQAVPLNAVTIDATDTGSPTSMSLRLKRPDNTYVYFPNGTDTMWYTVGAGVNRLVARVDEGGSAVHEYTAEVTSHYTGGGTAMTPLVVHTLTINTVGGPYGAGWSVAGVRNMRVASYLLAGSGVGIIAWDGTGTVQYFPRSASNPNHYDPPAGEFSSFDYVGTLYATRDVAIAYRQSFPDSSKVFYDASGRELYADDRFGNSRRVKWLDLERIDSIIDPAGKWFRFTYNGSNKLSSIRDAGGRVTSVTIDGNGDLANIVNARGDTAFRGSYETWHALKRSWNARRDSTDYVSDQLARIQFLTLPTIVASGSSVRPQMAFYSPEAVALGTYGAGGSATPLPRVRPDTLHAVVNDPRGISTKYKLDRFRQPVEVEDAVGAIDSVRRNPQGQATRLREANGHIVGLVWSGPDLVQANDSTRGQVTTIGVHTASHMIDSVVSTGMPKVRNYWDAQHRYLDSTMVVAPGDTAVTRYAYRTTPVGAGRVTKVTDPRGHETEYAYFSTGFWNVQTTSSGGRTTQFAYDTLGRLATVTDPLGRVVERRHYDVLDRDSVLVGPRADTTRFAYGRIFLDSVTDALGQRHRFARNALGWVTKYTDPTSHGDSSAYDRSGNVLQAITRRGLTISTTYDALNRPLVRSASGVSDTLRYDPQRRWQVAASAESHDSTVVDAAGRATGQRAERGPSRAAYAVLSWAYDAQDRRMSRVVMTGSSIDTTRYHYDPRGRLDTLTDRNGRRTAINYNQDDQANYTLLPGPVALETGYGSSHDETVVRYTAPGGVHLPFGGYYSVDTIGRIAKHRPYADSTKERRFTYDTLGQLRTVARYDITSSCTPYWTDTITGDPDGYNCPGNLLDTLYRYAYDKAGNRSGSGTAVATGNRQTEANGYTYSFDLAGNVARKYLTAGATTFDQYFTVWDALERPTRILTSTSAGMVVDTVDYGYDPGGLRVKRTQLRRPTTNVTTYFVWDGDELAVELDNVGNLVAGYDDYPGIDQPHALRLPAATYYYAHDGLGNVVGLTDSTGARVGYYGYGPFGEFQFDTSSVANSRRWKGRELDATTGLYYMRARWYDPQVGRFVSEDPIGLDGGINPYLFAGNDPVNYSDPSGLDCETDMLQTISWEKYDQDPEAARLWASRSCAGAGLLPPVITTGGWTQGWGSVFGMGVDWLSGSGSATRTFGSESQHVANMRDAPGTSLARDLACAGLAAGVQPDVRLPVGFGLSGLIDAGSNPTRQFVGSYVAYVKSASDGQMRFTLKNTTSMTSAGYHLLPSWERSSFRPGGNMRQIYTWTESTASCR